MKFVATFRVLLESPTEVEAQVAAEALSETIEEHLDEGDDLRLMEVINADNAATYHELALTLRVARNKLLATKKRDAYDLARQLDQMAWDIHVAASSNNLNPSYDHGKFIDVARAVWDGSNPLD